jgi:hypothetical protein
MADAVDRLFQQWHRLGGPVLVAQAEPAAPDRSPEDVIAESTAHCRESGRLMWVTLDWLLRHIEQIDHRRLLEKTQEFGDQSVLGVLCDSAYQRNPHPKLAQLKSACSPPPRLEVFFHRVARNPLAARLARENGLEIFRRWNYLCEELRYL